jgi:ABC-type Fe3+ transport system permease subunit
MDNGIVAGFIGFIIFTIVGIFMIVDREEMAKRQFRWREGDSPESLGALQKAVAFFGAGFLIIGLVCLLLAVVNIISKSLH